MLQQIRRATTATTVTAFYKRRKCNNDTHTNKLLIEVVTLTRVFLRFKCTDTFTVNK